jgi:hypothetical protein
MAVALGTATTFGSGEESTYGTAATVDEWYEILSESLQFRENRLASMGIGGGSSRRLSSSSREVVSTYDAGGSVEMEVAKTGFGRWFKYMIDGTPVSALLDTTAYSHTFALGQALPTGLTIQKGLFDAAGTEIERFTYSGGKVLSWEFSIASGQILKLSCELDFQSVETTTALAAATYGTPEIFTFAEGSLEIDSGAVGTVTAATVRGRNNLKTDSYYVGSGGLKGEPEDDDYAEVDGTIDAEFDDPTVFHDRLLADTAASLDLIFTGNLIEATYYESLTITVPEIKFTGGTPTVDGRGVVMQSVPWVGRDDGTNPGVTIVLQSTDTTFV